MLPCSSVFLNLIPLLLLLSVAIPGTPSASVSPALNLHVDTIVGEKWSAQGVTVEIELRAPGANELAVKIDKILLPEQTQEIENVKIECSQLRIDPESLSCDKATVSLDHPLVSPTAFTVSFDYRYAGPVSGSFSNLPLSGGSLTGQFAWHESRWSVSAQGKGIRLQSLQKLLGNTPGIKDFELAGEFDLDLDGKGDLQGVHELDIAASTGALNFTDPSSLRVGEKLELAMTLKSSRAKQDWQFDAELRMRNGQLYIDPLYLEFESGKPLTVEVSGLWSGQEKRLQLDALSYHHSDVLQASGEVEFSVGESPGLRSGHVNLISGRFPALYAVYLQPFLIGTAADELQTTGEMSGEFDYRGGDSVSLRLNPNALQLNDKQGRFAVSGMDGEINWSSHADAPPTRLSLESGKLYKIELGAAQLEFQSGGYDLRLLKPVVVPVFDGELRLASLAMENVAKENMSWSFDADLTPVSMELLTAALDWPSMAGKLSGMIPDVSYENGKLVVGGALLLRVFEGDIVVNKLRMQQPWGVVPMLSADIDIYGIDLETLTRTFSFGKIQGRLEGQIEGLRLIDWRPVQFDARFATPKDDSARHRISQRAIDDLTSIGGGVAGALSGSFMRFFEDFSYDRIGLSCRLSNGVCQMDGISPAKKGGYYIVKGRGLPRIDVIGYTHRVDWFELVERLKNIRLEHAPVVR